MRGHHHASADGVAFRDDERQRGDGGLEGPSEVRGEFPRDGANSHFLDMRGEARRVSPSAFYVRNGERHGEAVLCIAYAPAMPEGMRSAGSMPFTGVYAPYRGGWYEAAKMHRAWMETQPRFKAAAARDFLFDGTLLKPAKLTCATKRTAFLSAGCYTRPKDGKVIVQKALPTVLHSEWRARDGREAAVLANWTMEPQTYRLDFGGGKTVSGTLAAREWRLVVSPHVYRN